MRLVKIALGLALAAAIGCGDDDDGNNTTADAGGNSADSGGQGFQQPAGTVAVNFTVDDTANKVYTQGDLQWKGSMVYMPDTRKIIKDSTWAGPWAELYDDGPWSAGGHEPAGATAGDHKWGITVFATPPATGMDTYEYGLNDADYQTAFGDGWSWIGSNGMFNVAAGATNAVTATGQTFPKFGTTDLQITIDLAAVTGDFDKSKVQIKGSAWAWGKQNLTIANNKAVFTLSEVTGAGKPFAHTGLLSTGAKPEFIVVFGTGDGKEYKDMDGNALKTGVTAGTKAMGAATFTPVTINVLENKNTSVTIP